MVALDIHNFGKMLSNFDDFRNLLLKAFSGYIYPKSLFILIYSL